MTDTTSRRTPPMTNAMVRTHLANERTFLAWVRTGLTCMALGVAAAQLLDAHTLAGVSLSTLLGVLLVALGACTVVVGRLRFRSAAIGINQGIFRARRRGLDTVVIGSLAIAVLAVVVTISIGK